MPKIPVAETVDDEEEEEPGVLPCPRCNAGVEIKRMPHARTVRCPACKFEWRVAGSQSPEPDTPLDVMATAFCVLTIIFAPFVALGTGDGAWMCAAFLAILTMHVRDIGRRMPQQG